MNLIFSLILLTFGIIDILFWTTGCCEWIHMSGVQVKLGTGLWIGQAGILGLIGMWRNFSNGHYRPFTIGLMALEMAICGFGFLSVVIYMAQYRFAPEATPSLMTVFCFCGFWGLRCLELLQEKNWTNNLYLMLTAIGLTALLGHAVGSPLLYFQFAGVSNAMAVVTATSLVMIGLMSLRRGFWKVNGTFRF